MIVSQHMTPNPICVAPDFSVGAAMKIMDDCAIRHLPVLEDGHLVGIVSDRDLLASQLTGDERVSDLMHPWVITVSADDQIVSALVEAVTHQVGCLPVLDDGQLVGILTEMDLLGLYSRIANAPERKRSIDPPVSAIARLEAVTIPPSTTSEEASELCHHKGFRHLLVMQDNDLVGILSDRDLRASSGAGLKPSTPVDQLMSDQVQAIAPSESLSSAAARMVEFKISALPVVSDNRSPGIITCSDLLDYGLAAFRDSQSN
ncbi:MAG: CBS domain-containing protein [Planctomycetota bacterium]|jgi:CBS domain-containing protein